MKQGFHLAFLGAALLLAGLLTLVLVYQKPSVSGETSEPTHFVNASDGCMYQSTGSANSIHLPLVLKDDGPAPSHSDRLAMGIPPLDGSVATDIYEATTFIYSGTNPIQSDVAPGVIDPLRIALLRGRILDHHGLPIENVRVRIPNRPQYGQTVSDSDGIYTMAVNGGETLTLCFEMVSHLPAQRRVEPNARRYHWLPDTILLTMDSQSTVIDLSDPSPIQVARGSIISDSDGIRQATLLFAQGTKAEMILPGGLTQTLTTLTVRATEYTVGEDGLEAMPAALPDNSGYTYAVEFTVDEALASGAESVRFSQPVIFYLDNFLEFPTGMDVPLGYFDRQQARWIPSDDGRVVEVVSVIGGMAELDTDGDGQADNGFTLGIDENERAKLADLFQPGKRFWRMAITHFTPWDPNWPYTPPEDAEPPPDGPETARPEDEPCLLEEGSEIECQNQVFGEKIALVGVPYTLNYRSNRQPGFPAERILQIPLTDGSVHPDLLRVDLEIEIVGQKKVFSFAPVANQSHTFAWDGLDGFGRAVQGTHIAKGRTGYVYRPSYTEPADFPQSFGSYGGAVIQGVQGRGEIILWREWEVPLSVWDDARLRGLGGWSLNIHHSYDPSGLTLRLGDGTQRRAENLSQAIQPVAGTGEECVLLANCGDGGPALDALLVHPREVSRGPDGSLYIATNCRIRRVDPDGIINTLVGTQFCGYNGDGILASLAQVKTPSAPILGPDNALYFADSGNNRIRRIGPDGIITTVAGNGFGGFAGDGGPAVDARLFTPEAVDFAPDGGLLIADHDNFRVRRVGTNGIINTVAGAGNIPLGGDGGPAIEAGLTQVRDVVWGPDGAFYISAANAVRRVGPDGIITTITGRGGSFADGIPPAQARFHVLRGIDFAPDGTLYLVDYGRNVVRRIGSDGLIRTVAGNGTSGFSGDGGAALLAQFWGPSDVWAESDRFFVADTGNHRARSISPLLPGFSMTDSLIASEDGEQVFRFDRKGRHIETLNALTAAPIFQFSYDSLGLLATVTNGDGVVTAIERSQDGYPIAIIGPYGQRTELTLDTNGFLASVTNPAGESHTFKYDSGGLLLRHTDPAGYVSEITYDIDGRLTSDGHEDGFEWNLSRISGVDAYSVTLVSGQGFSTTHTVFSLVNGDERRLVTFPDGTRSDATVSRDGQRATTYYSGMTTAIQEGPDPRWGLNAPLPVDFMLSSPGGLNLHQAVTRTVSLSAPLDLLSVLVMTETINTNGRTTTEVYSTVDQVATRTTILGRQRVALFDALGRELAVSIPGIHTIEMSYDADGRLESMGQADRVLDFAYDSDGNLQSISVPLGRQVTYDYDLAGRVTQMALSGGQVIQYGYDANGNINAITPPGRPAHVFSYTAGSLLAAYIPPDLGHGDTRTELAYNADRQLTQIARPDGSSIELSYNSAGHLETVAIPQGAYQHTYDPLSGLQSAVAAPGGVTLTFEYDGELLTQEAWSGVLSGTVVRGYDDFYRLSSTQVNTAPATIYQYDDDSLLVQAGDLILVRDGTNGLLTGTSLGVVSDTLTYDAFGDLIGYSAHGNNPVLDIAYERDIFGRVVTKTEVIDGLATEIVYGYDLADRLTSVSQNGALTTTYYYDENDNLLQLNAPGGSISATYDLQDRLLTMGMTSYTYNAQGDLVTRARGGLTTTYEYDPLGNLLEVTLNDGTEIRYLVDGRYRRVGKMVDGLLVQGWLYQDALNPIAELDGVGNIVSQFVYGRWGYVPDYMIRDGQTYRLISDHLGSVRLVVDADSGAIMQRLDYDPFGRVISDTNPGFQPFAFVGGLYDPQTGLTRFGVRDYDAETGRWTTKDPILFAGNSTNLYAYAGDDPINGRDPSGQGFWGEVWDAVKKWGPKSKDWYDEAQDLWEPAVDANEDIQRLSEIAADEDLNGGEKGFEFLDTLLKWCERLSSGKFDLFPWGGMRKTLNDGRDAVREADPGRRERRFCNQQGAECIN